MDIYEYIKRFETEMKEYDSIYHDVAVRFGLSDTAMWILYHVSDEDEVYTQQDLCRLCSFAKQTINTSLTSLVKNGYAVLIPIEERPKSKRIVLTQKGRELAECTTDRLKKAEIAAHSRFTEQELIDYFNLTVRLTAFLREEMKNI